MQTSKTEILITVHGIRTFGQWQNRPKNLVRMENPDVIIETYGYGYFNALAFFIPFFRWLAARAFQRRLRDLLKQHANAHVSIVAHSFGTHILAWGLRGLRADEMPHVRTLILSGSVLKSNFDWGSLFRTNRLERVVNDGGLNDGILVLSQLFVLFTGMAGRIGFYGFTNEKLLNRYFRGGHSHYFQPSGSDPDAFMRRWWVPLLAHGASPEQHDDRENPGPLQGLWYTIIQVADPVKLAVYGGVVYAVIYWGAVLPWESFRLEQVRAIARDASELLASGNVQEASRKALSVLERPGPLIPQSYDVLYNALFNLSIRAKQIDVGNYNNRSLVQLGREDEVIILTDRGNLSIWSSEGINKFRLDDLDFMSSPTFAPDGSALFFDNSLHGVGSFDLIAKSKTTFSHFMLDDELKPGNSFLALDRTKLVSCRDKRLIAFSAVSKPDEDKELTVEWERTLNIDGDCSVLHQHHHRLFSGTSEAKLVVFDTDRKEVQHILDGRVAGLKYGIDQIIASEGHVVVRGFSDVGWPYVLLGLSPGQPYRFDSLGFSPQFSNDGRFLIYGWNGKLDSNERLMILDLSRPDVPKGLKCLCALVGFVGTSQFVTLDHGREINLRNLPDGEIASLLFVFEADVDNVVFLEGRNLAVGLRKHGITSFARLGQKDNSLQYGGLGDHEFLSDAMWLDDDVVLLKIRKISKDDWLKTDLVTHKLVRHTRTGSEVFWSLRSDEAPRAGDQWSASVSQAFAALGLMKKPSREAMRIRFKFWGNIAMEFLGIDFSGNARSWRSRRATSNVWVCRVKCGSELRPHVTQLQPVQCLVGNGPPFGRLAGLLAGRQFSAAAIDAPFSLPSRNVPEEGWLTLLELIDALPHDSGVPFPGGQSLIALAQTISDLECPKPLRNTEKLWSDRRINVRSTLWWKPRGGAPFAAACMKLLARAGFPPCWPWLTKTEGIVVEAFPAAQLWSWKLPFQKYDGRDGISVRQEIIRSMEERHINFGGFRKAAEETADALDAVISSFAAIAVFRGEAKQPNGNDATVAREGWIAVHP